MPSVCDLLQKPGIIGIIAEKEHTEGSFQILRVFPFWEKFLNFMKGIRARGRVRIRLWKMGCILTKKATSFIFTRIPGLEKGGILHGYRGLWKLSRQGYKNVFDDPCLATRIVALITIHSSSRFLWFRTGKSRRIMLNILLEIRDFSIFTPSHVGRPGSGS